MAADLDAPDLDAYDEQDQSEVFDEDNTELESQRYGGRDNGETLEELPDVLDVTQAQGDDDDDAEIGEEMDDDEIVASATDDDDDDAEDDDALWAAQIRQEGLSGIDDAEDLDGMTDLRHGEVELEYVGDLNDVAAAASAAQSLESDSLSDNDLRELDYKDEFTVDEDGGVSPAQ